MYNCLVTYKSWLPLSSCVLLLSGGQSARWEGDRGRVLWCLSEFDTMT